MSRTPMTRVRRSAAVLTAAALGLALPVLPAAAAPSDEGRVTAKAIADEGIVLLKNEAAALPLRRQTRLSVFGSTQVAPFLGGGGSGSVVGAGGVGLLSALRGEGFELNEPLASRYETWWSQGLDGSKPGKEQDYRPVADTGGAFDEFGINSVARAEMDVPADVLAQAAAFSDTAVVVIGRNGSEVHDPRPGDLELYEGERKMVDAVATRFAKVVVLFNTATALEMGFLEQYPSIEAAAAIWTPGQLGMLSVADMLSGDVNPSGKLPHSIAYRTEDHPSTVNVGDFVKPGSTAGRDKYYVEYEEGIYVGYRYFETFDVPVQFPFGHGLSYTSFDRDVLDVDYGASGLSVATRVTNTGKVPGKEVVQIYVEAPDGELEKPAKELRAFGKTELLQPGASQIVTTTVDAYGLSSWSEARGAYLLDAGAYTVLSGSSVQDVDVAGRFSLPAPVVIAKDPATGTPLQNRFAAAAEGLTVLSKQDPVSTAPTAPATGTRTVSNTSPLGSGFNAVGSGNPPGFLNAPGAMPALTPDGSRVPLPQGQVKATIQLQDVYADPSRMDAFLAQFTDPELVAMQLQGGFKTLGIDRLGIPATRAQDGPAQVKAPAGSGQSNGTGFPAASMLAATWNVDLARRYGAAAGAEARAFGVDAWYAPGANTHRNPMGGRNFEYYSEDPLLGAGMMANVVVGAGEQGVTTVIKHFVGNEQETNRQGVETFVSERALREIYLKPFEYGVKAGSLGIMASFNRLGETWAGATPQLLDGVARGEWGFDGFVVSDIWISPYMNAVAASRAGTDLMLFYLPTYNPQGLADFSRALTQDRDATRAALEANARHVLQFVLTTPAFSTVLGSTVNVRRPLDRSALPFTASTKLGVDIADVRDLQEALEQYAADKAIARPVARQLGAALDAAVRHADRGREVHAARQVETFVDRLRRTRGEDSISDEAKQRLRLGAATALRVLSDA